MTTQESESSRAARARDLARAAERASRIAEIMTSVLIASDVVDRYVAEPMRGEGLDARVAARARRISESLGRLYQDLGLALTADEPEAP